MTLFKIFLFYYIITLGGSREASKQKKRHILKRVISHGTTEKTSEV